MELFSAAVERLPAKYPVNTKQTHRTKHKAEKRKIWENRIDVELDKSNCNKYQLDIGFPFSFSSGWRFSFFYSVFSVMPTNLLHRECVSVRCPVQFIVMICRYSFQLRCIQFHCFRELEFFFTNWELKAKTKENASETEGERFDDCCVVQMNENETTCAWAYRNYIIQAVSTGAFVTFCSLSLSALFTLLALFFFVNSLWYWSEQDIL